MPNDDSATKTTDRPIGSYRLVERKNGSVEIVVTSGALKGKTALVIPTSPAAAYFSESPKK